MKKETFRTVDFWKSAIMTMPDNSFFELLRSVFGKIKTPFNKQQLLIDLETFLLRDDIQKIMSSYINENDSKIIAAIALFGEPVPEELESFFCGEFNSAQLQDLIVNMEERFILYRFIHEKKSHLALNPVLKNILMPFTQCISLLFPAATEASANTVTEDASSETITENKIACNDLVIAALIPFASQWDSFLRADGTERMRGSRGVIRKRVIEAGKTCFPGINLEKTIGSLQILGLFYADGERLVHDKKRIDEFAMLSPRERGEYCAAALLVYNGLTPPFDVLPPLFRAKIRETANLIHSFINSIKEGTLYTESTLGRMLEILKAQTNFSFNNSLLFESLERNGLIEKVSGKLVQLGAIVHNKTSDCGNTAAANSVAVNSVATTNAVIAIDSGSSIIVYPEINFTDAINLVSFLNIREIDAENIAPVIRFQIDKNSSVRAFNNNITAEEIINLLNRLSDNKVSDTLIWNLNDWEKRHGEVSLKKGVVLSLAEEHRYLTETKPLIELIYETLAPGVYLLSEDAIDDAELALRCAGIDIIAKRKDKKTPSESLAETLSPRLAKAANANFPSLSSYSLEEIIPDLDSSPVKKFDNNIKTLTAGFHTILKKIPLSDAEKNELSARIDRRLVLCESQLKEASIRYEKLEARHMDYAGKQNVAKQAISMQSPLEVVWLAKDKEKNIFGIPRTLEKDNGELILVIHTSSPDQSQQETRIPLAKISLLRRIKKSIFEI